MPKKKQETSKMGGTAASKFSDDTNDLLLAQLKCPVCLNRCTLPIYMCCNGHNVCSTCQPSLNTCPVCRVAGRPTNRNLFAEEFLQSEIMPCKNAEHGCKKVLKLKDLKEHLLICNYGFKCMFEDCRWVGYRGELFNHLQALHHKHIHPVLHDGVQLVFEDIDKKCKKCGENCGRPRVRTAYFVYEWHAFWFTSEQTGNSKFKVQIRLVPNSDDAPIHFYQLQFQSRDGNRVRTLLYNNQARSLTAPAFSDVVFDEDDDMKKYMQGNTLPFVLSFCKMILEIGVTHFRRTAEFSPQLRQRSLPNWEDLDCIELGRGSNGRVISKEEFCKYMNYPGDEKNVELLDKDYESYLIHVS